MAFEPEEAAAVEEAAAELATAVDPPLAALLPPLPF